MLKLISKYASGGANIPSGTRKYVALDSIMESTIIGLTAAYKMADTCATLLTSGT
jgi:hypothetical protein